MVAALAGSCVLNIASLPSARPNVFNGNYVRITITDAWNMAIESIFGWYTLLAETKISGGPNLIENKCDFTLFICCNPSSAAVNVCLSVRQFTCVR